MGFISMFVEDVDTEWNICTQYDITFAYDGKNSASSFVWDVVFQSYVVDCLNDNCRKPILNAPMSALIEAEGRKR